MKSHTLKRPVAVLALLLTTTAFAANRGSLHVSSPEDVGGQQLPAGDYTVRWEDRGPDVELTIMRGKAVKATASAYVRPLQDASLNNSVVIDTEEDGSPSLSQVFFAGKRVSLEIRSAAPETNSSHGN